MLNVEVAKGSGFCFGVNRAVEMVESLLKRGEKVCTLGELIHNRPFCDDLKQKGVRLIEDVCCGAIMPGESLIIRSHGVGPQVYEACLQRGINFVDATCPFVKRIHKIVESKSKQGKTILIAGDENHPEVIAIKKYCSGKVFIFSKFADLWPYLKTCSGNLVLVAQTTFSSVAWKEGVGLLQSGCFDKLSLEIFNTICYVTENRQKEAIELAKRVEVMIVIGGKNSSNSKKLFELCNCFCKTLFVEKSQEVEQFLSSFKELNSVGICAGASTPRNIVKEVHDLVLKSAL